MTYQVELVSRRVEKQILNLPRDVRSRVARVMLELEESPRPHGRQKLLDDIYRLRMSCTCLSSIQHAPSKADAAGGGFAFTTRFHVGFLSGTCQAIQAP